MLSKSKLQAVFVSLTTLLFVGLSILATFAFHEAIFGQITPALTPGDFSLLAAIYMMVYILDIALFSGNRDLLQKGMYRLPAERLAVGTIMLVMFSVLAILTKSPLGQQRRLLGSCCITYTVFSFLGLLLLRPILRGLYKTRFSTLTGVITVSDRAPELIGALKSHWNRKIVGVALLDSRLSFAPVGAASAKAAAEGGESADGSDAGGTDADAQFVSGVPVKAGFETFLDWVRTESLDEVYVDIPYDDGITLRPYLEEIQSMGTVIHLNAAIVENLTADGVLNLNREFKTLNGKPLLTFSLARHNPWALAVKRLMDIVIGLVGSVLSAPIILITAIPLLIESPGPLIFKQKRMGKNGRVFNVYKLRSMYRDAEERKAALMAQNEMSGHMFKMKDDPRITKVGKFIRRTSIDELPQFWNILKGDMSFVGTRPPTLKEYEQYSPHHKRRLSMKPGLTGIWQVSGRSDITDFEEVVKLDTWYIDNWSLLLDIKIMFKTVWVVLTRKGSE
ncbi:MAG: sugar transferase [Eubacteriales bacterium]